MESLRGPICENEKVVVRHPNFEKWKGVKPNFENDTVVVRPNVGNELVVTPLIRTSESCEAPEFQKVESCEAQF